MNETASTNEIRFGFGHNWSDYIEKHFSRERVEIAKKHLLGFLKLDDFEGRSFLDIGCGSGLHSLAALQSGASAITSFDYDLQSVETTMKLHELAGSPPHWKVMQGSVLDRAFVESLPSADVVYSWGVLHHTGSMWEAVDNTAHCMSDASLLYIALYSSDVYVSPTPEYWIKLKRAYNSAGPLRKRLMESKYAGRRMLGCIKRGENPFKYVKDYKVSRGMSYWHDLKDWLGGYPMEFAGNKETETFCRDRLGLKLCNITAGEGCTEYLFQHQGQETYWDEIENNAPLHALSGPYEPVRGLAWSVALSLESDLGLPEGVMLYENGSPVGWPEAPLDKICSLGQGRYRVEGDRLIFSTTDSSDPNVSHHQLTYRTQFT